MKILKRLLQIVIALVGISLVVVVVILGIDAYKTSYLNVKKDSVSNNSTYVISNANIIPMYRDTVLMNTSMYVENGIIINISDSIDIEGVVVFDAKGRYLMPGLIDMHVHVWDRYELGLYLSNGVTAVRNLWGMPMHLRIKEAIKNDKIYGPAFFSTGPKLTGPEFIGDDNLNLANPKAGRDKVATYKSRGYDFIKTYYGLDKEIFDGVIEQAEINEMDVVAHPSQRVAFSYHLHPQIKSIEHAEEIVQQALQFDLDTGKLKMIIDTISNAKQTNYCPTITVFNNIYQMLIDDNILDSEPIDYMNPLIKMEDSKNQFNRWYNTKKEDLGVVRRIKEQHKFHLNIVAQLHKAGVPIICGTDAGIGITTPGFSIHKELAFYKEAGLSNYEVLKTATANAARTHAIMNQLGTIEVGKVADFIITDSNPLLDLSTLEKPSYVFIKGRKLDRNALDAYEERAKNRKNLLATGLRYLENLIIEK